jgi:hypothetical protein
LYGTAASVSSVRRDRTWYSPTNMVSVVLGSPTKGHPVRHLSKSRPVAHALVALIEFEDVSRVAPKLKRCSPSLPIILMA